MSNRILRWGLLSTARINRSVIPPLKNNTRGTLAAVASRDQAKSEAYAREWGIPLAFGSYEAMLASPDIDVVYVSLPNSMHAEWSIKAAQAGKHVLCEKSLACTVEDVDAMIAAAAANKTVLAEAFMFRHHPQTLAVKQMIESGAIGEIRLMRGSFSFQMSPTSAIRLVPELGGGSIWDVGCYPISYARYLAGADPVEVFGYGVTGESGVDETFAGTLRFASGAIAQFDSGFRAPFRTHFEIVGSEGMIVVPHPFKPFAQETIMVGTAYDELKPVSVSGLEHLYSGEIDDLTDAVLEGKPQRVTLRDSRGGVATNLALLRSAKTGLPVAL